MSELLVATGLIAGVVVAHEIGFELGLLKRTADEPFDRQIGLVRTSTAALVAFLIAFAFSGAATRFTNRTDFIVKEANALGTAYLRADAIAEPHRSQLKAALREYSADRVALLSREGRDQIEPLLSKVSGLHERMWRSVGDHCYSGQRGPNGGGSAADQRGPLTSIRCTLLWREDICPFRSWRCSW
jgi:hypothetical protein